MRRRDTDVTAQRLRPPPSLAGLLFRITLARLGAAAGAIMFPWLILAAAITAFGIWLLASCAPEPAPRNAPTELFHG